MKRGILFALVGVMSLALPSLSLAGDRARGRWEGFAIGLGAVTAYNLVEHGIFSPVIPRERAYEKEVYHEPPVVYGRHVDHHPAKVYKPSGHWEIHQEWIPKKRQRVWVPRHRENGYWVKGHYQVRVYPGHYEKRRVWVKQDSYGHRVKKGPPPWAPARGHRAKHW